ncbi:hypothetical protein SNE35_02090 [Paucibacter sp. R3-3]|uniref:Uncharacterized protein n=1 Tax=Roseateles agri TaxID=3098619 RepID=A0ABU5DAG6_9BURK|nr:hypothetical protein [Paucibacter sp. R3-3]MDY0743273.1 hypothetical protein [Paucibacter sp. R3-3]
MLFLEGKCVNADQDGSLQGACPALQLQAAANVNPDLRFSVDVFTIERALNGPRTEAWTPVPDAMSHGTCRAPASKGQP